MTNLGVFDFEPDSRKRRVRSLHPGVEFDTVQEATGFELLPAAGGGNGQTPVTPEPTAEELRVLRDEVDPTGARLREF